MDIKKKDLIKFLNNKIGSEDLTTYKEIKDELKNVYITKRNSVLLEEYDSLKFQKIAEESMSSENKPIGMVAVLSLIVSMGLYMYDSLDVVITVNAFIIFILIVLMYVFFIYYRIEVKAKNLVYFNLAIEVIEDVLKDKKLLQKRARFN